MSTKFRTIQSLTRQMAAKRRQNMAQSGVIIRRNAGLVIPDAYSTLALKENPTAWGVAIITPEGLMINSGNDLDLELFNATIEEFKTRDIHFYLCNAESALNMDDVSPYNILEKDEVPQLIAFIDGAFPGFAKTGSSHPSEYHFVNDFIIPKVQGMYEMCDGDLDKVMLQIEKPLFKKELMLHANPRGFISLIASNGKALTFAQGEGAAEYKWGWVSKNYGYATGATAEPQAEKKRSMFPSKSTVREKAPGTGQAVKEPETAGATVVKNFTTRKEKPRPTDSRKDRKLFYQRRIGYCPVGWDEKENGQYPSIEVWVDPDTNQMVTIGEIKKLGIEAVGVPVLKNPPRAEGKDVEPQHVSGNERETGPSVSTEVLPIMSPKAREFVKDMFRREDVKKLIAENGTVISDPNRIQEEEKKIVGFSEQVGNKDGLKDAALYGFLSFAEQKRWGRENPESYDVAMRSLICYFLASEATKKSKLTSEEVHVAAKEELRPAKKSMFPQKAVA